MKIEVVVVNINIFKRGEHARFQYFMSFVIHLNLGVDGVGHVLKKSYMMGVRIWSFGGNSEGNSNQTCCVWFFFWLEASR